MGWATFWAIFSQTHLVTLLGDHSLVPFFPPRQISVSFTDKIRVARFFSVQYTKTGRKCTKLSQKYQMTIKYTRWP
jgi:hypothetical protein